MPNGFLAVINLERLPLTRRNIQVTPEPHIKKLPFTYQ